MYGAERKAREMQLNSKNYKNVGVYLRGEDYPITMKPDQGAKLMHYLTTSDAATHIQLTDIDGYAVVVNKHEIKKIVPDYVERKVTYKADW